MPLDSSPSNGFGQIKPDAKKIIWIYKDFTLKESDRQRSGVR